MTTQASHQGLLRFITAGSVDDGKSTLIGRLLYDSKAVLTDQLQALANAKNKRTAGEQIDFSLLTDGLEAEREQGITIDVAYRYFSTARRKFIIADTPGHEQYTRNMVTGASTAHAAIILIDATRVTTTDGKTELLAQTKRHSAIVKLLELQHVIVAVNKMDLVDYSEARFNEIRTAYNGLAAQLGLRDVRYVPVSALRGDNIVHVSEAMPWYQGEPLLALLEDLKVEDTAPVGDDALRFPVQLVARQDGSQADDFRGYMGRVEAGTVRVGQAVRVLPANRETVVAEVLTPNGAADSAGPGETITVRLADDVDISRGDTVVAASTAANAARKLYADLCWFDEAELNPSRKYVLKHTTATVFARVSEVERVLDVHTLSHETGRKQIALNDIGTVSISLQKPIVCDAYGDNPATGAFILVDEATHHTVAAGMIRAFS
ncbi:sulfate adenylyltransferase subunit 1 (plasmid) [Ralstonia syzygii subsp. celebesensis]|uniref:sulfate adenylyltransferase n=3 Tax=Ralstonia solanacearum species complex TaxID=3116862 RepID=A0AAD0SD60_RALSL|nr:MULTISPECIES: sulfate adenylyltransferase subunit 1 [Ralstonia solanacearum species complex]CCA82631.1 ATP-sulfurylase, subunit 1 (ATP:sulfate adenylyltransferase) [blood disease bacterium R229]AQW31918.1 sulfate adenylyltransferase [blood disease bacterium A2-HR MARDI]AXV80872.1 sulfate adenylyltransferase subunit 1 [Ralstonia solanacearum]AXW52019.1 sulfate adenylyltransferase subunit 1 [Ralstonia solanacearum]QQV57315.1 sulfate adenylyltransferase subunit 1 [Ralstonia syzygii subsp. cele